MEQKAMSEAMDEVLQDTDLQKKSPRVDNEVRFHNNMSSFDSSQIGENQGDSTSEAPFEGSVSNKTNTHDDKTDEISNITDNILDRASVTSSGIGIEPDVTVDSRTTDEKMNPTGEKEAQIGEEIAQTDEKEGRINEKVSQTNVIPSSRLTSTNIQTGNKENDRKESKSQWGSYFKRAVANMEQTLDKVLMESSSEIEVVSSKSPLTNTLSQTQSNSRPSMQERLAMAVNNPKASNIDRTPSPASSRPSQEVLESRNIPSLSSSANPSVSSSPASSSLHTDSFNPSFKEQDINDPPSLDLIVKLSRELYDVVMLLDIPSDKDIVKSSFLNLIRDTELQQQRLIAENAKSNERINTLESKLKYLAQNEVERAVNTKKSSTGLEKKLAEKDEQIALLFQEGQILSKKELQYMSTIKKLRQKERDTDRSSEQASSTIHKLETELNDLRQKLMQAKDQEKLQETKNKKLTKVESENINLRNENAVTKSKVVDLEGQLKELTLKLDEEAKIADSRERTRLNSELESTKVKLAAVQTDFERSVEEKIALESQLEKEMNIASKRQIDLQNEIKNMESKVEYYRSMSEEASSQGVQNSAHIALLRQIEILQSQHAIATENWQGIESNLLEKISGLEKEVKSWKDQETNLRRKHKNLTIQLKDQTDSLENLNEIIQDLESGKVKFQAERDEYLEKCNMLENSCQELRQNLENTVSGNSSTIKDLEERLSKANLEISRLIEFNQLPLTAPSADEGFKNIGLNQSLSERQQPTNGIFEVVSPLAQQHLTYFSPNNSFDDGTTKGAPPLGYSPSPGQRFISRQMSGAESSSLIRSPSSQSFENPSESGFDDQHPTSSSFRKGTSPLDGISRVESTSISGQASFQLVGKMNTTLRRLELELTNYKQDLSKMTRAKDDAFQEVVKLMKENEELKEASNKVKNLERQIEELHRREQTTLEMLGEKSEQVEELKADVQDLKSMYRQQIEELVNQLHSN